MEEIKLGEESTAKSRPFASKTIIIKKYFFILMVCLILLLSALLIVLAATFRTTAVTTMSSNSMITTLIPTAVSTPTQDPFGPGPWESENLSDAIVPSDYYLNIRVFSPDSTVDRKYSYGGDLIINAQNTVADNNVLVLHASDLIMTYRAIYLLDKELPGGRKMLYVIESFMYEKNSYYVIILGEKLPADSSIEMSLQFERNLDSDESKGFFMRQYMDQDAKTKCVLSACLSSIQRFILIIVFSIDS